MVQYIPNSWDDVWPMLVGMRIGLDQLIAGRPVSQNINLL